MSGTNPTPDAYDWRTITALNIVSQPGPGDRQFGIIFVGVVPVWLALQGLSAAQLGFFAASLMDGADARGARHWRLGCAATGARAPWWWWGWAARWWRCWVLHRCLWRLLPWPAYLVCGLLAGLGVLAWRWVGLEPLASQHRPRSSRAGSTGRVSMKR